MGDMRGKRHKGKDTESHAETDMTGHNVEDMKRFMKTVLCDIKTAHQ